MSEFFGDNKPVEGYQFSDIKAPEKPAPATPAPAVATQSQQAQPQVAEPQDKPTKKLYDELVEAGKTEDELRRGVAKLRSGDKSKGLSDEDSKRRIVEDLGFPDSYVQDDQPANVQSGNRWREAVNTHGEDNAKIALRREVIRRYKESGDSKRAIDETLADVNLTRKDAINMGLLGRYINNLDKGKDEEYSINEIASKVGVFKNLDTAKDFALRAYGIDDEDLVTKAYNKAHATFESTDSYTKLVDKYGSRENIPSKEFADAKARHMVNQAVMRTGGLGLNTSGKEVGTDEDRQRFMRGLEKFAYGLARLGELPIPKAIQPRATIDFFNENNEEKELQEKLIDRELNGGVDWSGLLGEMLGMASTFGSGSALASAGASLGNIGRALASGSVKGGSLATKAGALVGSGAGYGAVLSMGGGKTGLDVAKDATIGGVTAGVLGGAVYGASKAYGVFKDFRSSGLHKMTKDELIKERAKLDLAKKVEEFGGVKLPALTISNPTEQSIATSNPINKYLALRDSSKFLSNTIDFMFDEFSKTKAAKIETKDAIEAFTAIRDAAKNQKRKMYLDAELASGNVVYTEGEISNIFKTFEDYAKSDKVKDFKFDSDDKVRGHVYGFIDDLKRRMELKSEDRIAEISKYWDDIKIKATKEYDDNYAMLTYDLSQAKSKTEKKAIEDKMKEVQNAYFADKYRIEKAEAGQIKTAREGVLTNLDVIQIAKKREFKLASYNEAGATTDAGVMAQEMLDMARGSMNGEARELYQAADEFNKMYEDIYGYKANTLLAKGLKEYKKSKDTTLFSQASLPLLFKDATRNTSVTLEMYQKLGSHNLSDELRQKLTMDYVNRAGFSRILDYIKDKGSAVKHDKLRRLVDDFDSVDLSPIYALMPEDSRRGAFKMFEAFRGVLGMATNLTSFGTTLQGAKESVLKKMYNFTIGWVKSIPYLFSSGFFGGVEARLKKVDAMLRKAEGMQTSLEKAVEELKHKGKTYGVATAGAEAGSADVADRYDNIIDASQR